MICLAFAFWYLKLHDDIDVVALVAELKLLENISLLFVPDTFEIARDVSKALTSAVMGICRTAARLLRLYLTAPMSNAAAERSLSCLRRLKN